jgi:hypothetical protein
MIIGDRRDIDRDIVLGDDFLRGNLHRDGAQRDPHHLLQREEDKRDPCLADAFEFSEKKDHPALVLLEHANGAKKIQQHRNAKNINEIHRAYP